MLSLASITHHSLCIYECRSWCNLFVHLSDHICPISFHNGWVVVPWVPAVLTSSIKGKDSPVPNNTENYSLAQFMPLSWYNDIIRKSRVIYIEIFFHLEHLSSTTGLTKWECRIPSVQQGFSRRSVQIAPYRWL